jgi:hypothetical protein
VTRSALLCLVMLGCTARAPVHQHTTAAPEGNTVAPADESASQHVTETAREDATIGQRPTTGERRDVGPDLEVGVTVRAGDEAVAPDPD